MKITNIRVFNEYSLRDNASVWQISITMDNPLTFNKEKSQNPQKTIYIKVLGDFGGLNEICAKDFVTALRNLAKAIEEDVIKTT